MKQRFLKAQKRLSFKLRQIFLDNLGLKLLSVVIATLLWVYVASEERAEFSIKIPIRFENMPKNYTLVGDVPSEISVTVKGPKTLAFTIINRKLEFRVNMNDARPGIMDISVDPERLNIPYPMKVIKVSPSELRVEVDKIVKKKVPVEPVIQGEPHPDYTISRVDVDPDEVEVSGPSKIVMNIHKFKTNPIDISGFAVDTENYVSLNTSHYHGISVTPEKVKVLVKVKERYEKKVLKHIGVKVKGLNYPYKIIPSHVQVTVLGPVTLLRKLDASHVKAYVDLSGEGPGKYRRRAIIEIPSEFTFLDAKPTWFEVYVFPGNRVR